MALGLVVGIFSGTDPKELESALVAQQIDLSKVKVVSTTVTGDEDEGTQLEFVDVIADVEDNSRSDMTQGSGVWDETGTGVPGISSGGRRPDLSSFTHHDDPTRAYLAGYAIPSDEIDNFGDAVAEGRAVVLYADAGSGAQTVAASFKAAGLRNVRTF